MGIAQDLLQQAEHLASYEGANPSQASLRRAVSTAYYALFHLLTEDAALRWSGSSEARTGLERAFQHGPMKNTSIQFRQQTWKDWHGNKKAIPSAIQEIAGAFVDLQDERHAADYDNHAQWTATDVETILEIAHLAFQHWASIPSDAMAGDYLLAMLLTKQR